MNKIPSVDLNDFLSDDLQKKSLFVNTIGSAFQEIGFCAVRGHFLDDQLLKRLYDQIKLFFDLPYANVLTPTIAVSRIVLLIPETPKN